MSLHDSASEPDTDEDLSFWNANDALTSARVILVPSERYYMHHSRHTVHRGLALDSNKSHCGIFMDPAVYLPVASGECEDFEIKCDRGCFNVRKNSDYLSLYDT